MGNEMILLKITVCSFYSKSEEAEFCVTKKVLELMQIIK